MSDLAIEKEQYGRPYCGDPLSRTELKMRHRIYFHSTHKPIQYCDSDFKRDRVEGLSGELTATYSSQIPILSTPSFPDSNLERSRKFGIRRRFRSMKQPDHIISAFEAASHRCRTEPAIPRWTYSIGSHSNSTGTGISWLSQKPP
jgi:hypothetical protein